MNDKQKSATFGTILALIILIVVMANGAQEPSTTTTASTATKSSPNPLVPARYAVESYSTLIGQPMTWEQGKAQDPVGAQRALTLMDTLGRKGDLCSIEKASHKLALDLVQTDMAKALPGWTPELSEGLLTRIVVQYC